MIPFPDKKYQIIYADPPWNFSGYVKELKSGIVRPPLDYQIMSDIEIISLPVQSIISQNAILFMWIVDCKIPLIVPLMEGWGFTYKTVGFVWNKIAKHTTGVNATFSKYTRKSCEFLYVGTRGKCLAENHTQNQYVPQAKRKHSQKPDCIRDMIVKMCGDLPRIELFARKPQGQLIENPSWNGWDVWGNEV